MARPISILAVLSGVISAAVFADSDKPPVDVATPVKAAVNHFFDRIVKGQAKDNEDTFLRRDLPITGFALGRSDDRHLFQKTPAEFLKSLSAEPKFFVVVRIDVDRIHDQLAVARVQWKTGGARGHSVITWHNDGQRWRIVSFFQDEHFVW